MKYTEVPLNDFFTQILTPKFPAYLMFLEQNGNDWQAMNFLVTPNAVWNPSHYATPETDKLIEQIRTAKDAKAAAAPTKALGKIVTEQAWFVPWYRKQMSFASNSAKVKVALQAGNAVPYIWNFQPA